MASSAGSNPVELFGKGLVFERLAFILSGCRMPPRTPSFPDIVRHRRTAGGLE